MSCKDGNEREGLGECDGDLATGRGDDSTTLPFPVTPIASPSLPISTLSNSPWVMTVLVATLLSPDEVSVSKDPCRKIDAASSSVEQITIVTFLRFAAEGMSKFGIAPGLGLRFRAVPDDRCTGDFREDGDDAADRGGTEDSVGCIEERDTFNDGVEGGVKKALLIEGGGDDDEV